MILPPLEMVYEWVPLLGLSGCGAYAVRGVQASDLGDHLVPGILVQWLLSLAKVCWAAWCLRNLSHHNDEEILGWLMLIHF